ncbi:MAG: cell division protein ZapE [Sphingomonadales bacterium]
MIGPLARYQQHLDLGELKPDPSQKAVAEKLEDHFQAIIAAKTAKGVFKLFRGKDTGAPKSIYIWGPVGRGKSMLMDLFFESIPLTEKRRVHFHQFMQDIHSQIHTWRGAVPEDLKKEIGRKTLGDPIAPLAEKIASEVKLLCFDEFQVNDVADAMILGRLFQGLFDLGVVIISTSNRPPVDLYKDGLNRKLFLPFIDLIENQMEIIELTGPHDYRYQRIKGLQVYYTPVDEATTQKLKEAFWTLTDRDVGDPSTVPSDEIEVQGRKIFVPKCAKGVAVFSFKRLCSNPLGAADYLAIAWRYHTVIVVAIPKMGKDRRNEAKRFVTMIDVFYENNVKFICSAEGLPEELYPAGDGSFEFSRTASRLIEMQSKVYLAKGHAV